MEEEAKSVNIKSLNKDLQEFKEEVRGSVDKILAILEKPVEKVEEAKEIGTPPEGVKKLPQQYQVIFEEYFDIEDGFVARLDFQSNITFTIIVPLKFSNITDAYRDYYHKDERTVVLNQGDIEGGIRKWCGLVAKNLNYNRKVVTK